MEKIGTEQPIFLPNFTVCTLYDAAVFDKRCVIC